MLARKYRSITKEVSDKYMSTVNLYKDEDMEIKIPIGLMKERFGLELDIKVISVEGRNGNTRNPLFIVDDNSCIVDLTSYLFLTLTPNTIVEIEATDKFGKNSKYSLKESVSKLAIDTIETYNKIIKYGNVAPSSEVLKEAFYMNVIVRG